MSQEIAISFAEGGYGKVYMIMNTNSDRLYARKIYKEKVDGDKYYNREITNFEFLKNSYGFVRLISQKKENDTNMVDMDFITGGSLTEILAHIRDDVSIDGFDKTQEIIIAYGISYLISKLHRYGIIHRDIKPSNILLDHDLRPYIADLGFARKYSLDSDMTHVGSPNYCAPEVFNEAKKISIKSDVYMFGCTLYEMVEIKPPYHNLNSNQIIEEIEKNKPLKFERAPGHLLIEVIQMCMKKNPDERPTMDEVTQKLIQIAHGHRIEDVDNEIIVEDFDKYVEFLENMDKKSEKDIPFCGTVQNLIIAAKRGIHFSVKMLSKAKMESFDFKQNQERVEKILNRMDEQGYLIQSDSEEEEIFL